MAEIETQTDIALCVPKSVAREVVGREGSILLSSWGSFRTHNNLKCNWCSVGLCNSWWFNFGEGGKETEEQTENTEIMLRLRSQDITHVT